MLARSPSLPLLNWSRRWVYRIVHIALKCGQSMPPTCGHSAYIACAFHLHAGLCKRLRKLERLQKVGASSALASACGSSNACGVPALCWRWPEVFRSTCPPPRTVAKKGSNVRGCVGPAEDTSLKYTFTFTFTFTFTITFTFTFTSSITFTSTITFTFTSSLYIYITYILHLQFCTSTLKFTSKYIFAF